MKQGNKRYKAWCYGCDSNMVSGGKKCSYCGLRMVNKKYKDKDIRNELARSRAEENHERTSLL